MKKTLLLLLVCIATLSSCAVYKQYGCGPTVSLSPPSVCFGCDSLPVPSFLLPTASKKGAAQAIEAKQTGKYIYYRVKVQ